MHILMNNMTCRNTHVTTTHKKTNFAKTPESPVCPSLITVTSLSQR